MSRERACHMDGDIFRVFVCLFVASLYPMAIRGTHMTSCHEVCVSSVRLVTAGDTYLTAKFTYSICVVVARSRRHEWIVMMTCLDYRLFEMESEFIDLVCYLRSSKQQCNKNHNVLWYSVQIITIPFIWMVCVQQKLSYLWVKICNVFAPNNRAVQKQWPFLSLIFVHKRAHLFEVLNTTLQ